MAETPQSCQEHQPDYKSQSWEAYSLFELGMWVHLFAKRAEHRQNVDKRDKDLHDARNYIAMMQSKLDEISEGGKRLTMKEWARLYKEDRTKLGIPARQGTSNEDCVSDQALSNVERKALHLKAEASTWQKREAEARIRKMDAETAALHKVASEKHTRNVAQQRKAAGLDPRLPESDAFGSCPKMTDSERED